MVRRPDNVSQLDLIYIFGKPHELIKFTVILLLLGLFSYLFSFMFMFAQCYCPEEVIGFFLLGNSFFLFAILMTLISKKQSSEKGLSSSQAFSLSALLGFLVGFPLYTFPPYYERPDQLICFSACLVPTLGLVIAAGNLLLTTIRETRALESVNRSDASLKELRTSRPSTSARKYYPRSAESGKAASRSIPLFIFVAFIVAYPIMTNLPEYFTGMSTPTATMELNQTTDGNYTLNTSSLDISSVRLEWVKIQIINRTRVPVYQIDLDDLNSTQNFSSTVQFIDNDDDYRWTEGDEFHVASADNGGYAEPGFIIRLIFDPTDKTIASVEFN